MPTYQYECSACGHRFEEFQSFSDKELETCPQCQKSELSRLFGTGGGMIFKGGGFYETDYKKKGGSDSAPAEAPAAAPKSGGSCGCGAGGHSCS